MANECLLDTSSREYGKSIPRIHGLLMVLSFLLLTSIQAQEPSTPKTTDPRAQSDARANTVKLDATALYDRAANSVVLITAVDGNGKKWLGSGVIIRSDGLIATNFHVINGAVGARVQLHNGDIYDEVSIIDDDERKDIALVRIKAANLPALTIGDSDSLKVGNTVYAVGAPLGLEGSISQGLVSAIRPAKDISEQLEGFRIIQFTAPISHGNSGGPLLDERGSIVGLVSAYLPSGQNVNVAVPSNYVSGLVAGAKTDGRTLTKMRTETKRSGVLLAGYGSPDSGFQITFIELMNFLAAQGVAVANEPGNFKPVTGDYVSLNYLLDYVKNGGGEAVLYVTTEHGWSNIHRITVQCLDKDGKLLWKEKESSATTWAGSEDGAARAVLSKMQKALKKHVGQPGLPLKKTDEVPSPKVKP